MVFEKGFKTFAGNLAVEEEVLMVEDEEECSGAGLEVFQISSFDSECAVTALVGNADGIVIYLVLLASSLEMVVVAWPSHLIAQLARQS